MFLVNQCMCCFGQVCLKLQAPPVTIDKLPKHVTTKGRGNRDTGCASTSVVWGICDFIKEFQMQTYILQTIVFYCHFFMCPYINNICVSQLENLQCWHFTGQSVSREWNQQSMCNVCQLWATAPRDAEIPKLVFQLTKSLGAGKGMVPVIDG